VKRCLAVVLAALFPWVTPASAAERWADALNGSDLTGDGSQAAPYRTITKAVQSLVAVPGTHAVHVLPGLYDEDLGESFPIVLKNSMSLLGSGAHQTTVSGGGDGVLVRMAPKGLVSDMTLRRADFAIESRGLAFGTAVGLHTVRRCVLRDSTVGLYAKSEFHSDHGAVLVNSVVVNNDVGVAVVNDDCDFQSVTIQVYGSVITANADAFDPLYGLRACERYLGLYRSIVRGNGDDSLADWSTYFPGTAANVIADPALVGVNGNVDLDPLLVDGLGGDVHVGPLSGAVDLAGPPVAWPPQAAYNPVSAWVFESSFEAIPDLDLDPRLAGAAIDAGADELRVPTLYSVGNPVLGHTIELRGVAQPADVLFVFAGFALYDDPLLGFIWLQPPWVSLGTLSADAAGLGALPLAIPPDPQLAGADVYLQGARITGSGVDGTQASWIRLQP
jgi:hypothetical protein